MIKATKPVLTLGIKKGNFVGCKITLRKKNLINFLDNFILYLPFFETYRDPFSQNYIFNKKTNDFLFGVNNNLKFISLQNYFNQKLINQFHVNIIFRNLLIEEKLFFFSSYNFLIKK